jgi:hypothetical protein
VGLEVQEAQTQLRPTSNFQQPAKKSRRMSVRIANKMRTHLLLTAVAFLSVSCGCSLRSVGCILTAQLRKPAPLHELELPAEFPETRLVYRHRWVWRYCTPRECRGKTSWQVLRSYNKSQNRRKTCSSRTSPPSINQNLEGNRCRELQIQDQTEAVSIPRDRSLTESERDQLDFSFTFLQRIGYSHHAAFVSAKTVALCPQTDEIPIWSVAAAATASRFANALILPDYNMACCTLSAEMMICSRSQANRASFRFFWRSRRDLSEHLHARKSTHPQAWQD